MTLAGKFLSALSPSDTVWVRLSTASPGGGGGGHDVGEGPVKLDFYVSDANVAQAQAGD